MQIDTNTSTANWCYGIIPCQQGEKYVLNGYAGATYRIYSILDSNNVILDVSVGIHSETSAYHDKLIEIPENGVKLVVNINKASGFSSIQKIIGIEEYIGTEVFGYKRTYTDITHTLEFERKTIDNNIIVDSTTNILAELPNNGVVEVKMNAPLCKFKVFSYNGTAFTELTNGWTHYAIRYIGDYVSRYYVLFALQDEGTLTIANSGNKIKAYLLSDRGKKRMLNKTTLIGKNIAVFGDSIVQGRFCKFGTSVNMCMPTPYSNIIAEKCNSEPHNYGIGGATVYNTDWKSLAANVGLISGYDIVFVHAGTNDYGGNVTNANFTSAYTTVIQTLQSNNTEVVVVTPTPRTDRTGNNSRSMKLSDYANIEKNIANTYGCKVIDLLQLLDNASFKSTLSDGLHPSESGHAMIAEFIMNYY
jgi:hypothetical protein